MAFNNAFLTRVDVGLNNTYTINYSNGAGTSEGGFGVFAYNGYTVGDDLATITASNYFLAAIGNFQLNSVIFISATNGNGVYVVDAITYPDEDGVGGAITVASYAANGSVGTANIQNNAVTYAKMQQASTVTLLGNPTGGAADVSEITLGNALEFSGTTARVPLSNLVYATGTISAAQWNGMYAAPVLLVAAGGANTAYVVSDFALEVVYGTTQFASGGAVAVQYDSTINGGGAPASATIAAATINGISANSMLGVSGSLAVAASTALVNKGLYLSNITGAFTTGDSTFRYHIWYRRVATTA